MYSEKDNKAIGRRIKKYLLIWIPVIAACIAVFVASLMKRWEIVAMISGPFTFCMCLFAWVMYIGPCVRYHNFLHDMGEGLSRRLDGSIVEVSEQEDYQDGVRVLPVRIYLDDEDDERIVYLNVTKKPDFPKEGTHVQLACFGRHIKEVTVA